MGRYPSVLKHSTGTPKKGLTLLLKLYTKIEKDKHELRGSLAHPQRQNTTSFRASATAKHHLISCPKT